MLQLADYLRRSAATPTPMFSEHWRSLPEVIDQYPTDRVFYE